jgi:hypothetical protein
MTTEYVKRNYRKGYDENSNLLYKVWLGGSEAPAEEQPPLFVEEDEEA